MILRDILGKPLTQFRFKDDIKWDIDNMYMMLRKDDHCRMMDMTTTRLIIPALDLTGAEIVVEPDYKKKYENLMISNSAIEVLLEKATTLIKDK